MLDLPLFIRSYCKPKRHLESDFICIVQTWLKQYRWDDRRFSILVSIVIFYLEFLWRYLLAALP